MFDWLETRMPCSLLLQGTSEWVDARTSVGEVSPSRGVEDRRADGRDDAGSSQDSSRGRA
jgi:hypothetical protein